MRIKSLADIQSKWTTVTPTKSDYYKAGVSDPNVAWAAPAAAAEGSWGAGVQAAIGAKRFSKGINAAGDAAWRAGAAGKGVTNWSTSVAGAGAKYGAGYAPYQSAIANLTLPARGTRGSPQNLTRVASIANTLHTLKIQGIK